MMNRITIVLRYRKTMELELLPAAEFAVSRFSLAQYGFPVIPTRFYPEFSDHHAQQRLYRHPATW